MTAGALPRGAGRLRGPLVVLTLVVAVALLALVVVVSLHLVTLFVVALFVLGLFADVQGGVADGGRDIVLVVAGRKQRTGGGRRCLGMTVARERAAHADADGKQERHDERGNELRVHGRPFVLGDPSHPVRAISDEKVTLRSPIHSFGAQAGYTPGRNRTCTGGALPPCACS